MQIGAFVEGIIFRAAVFGTSALLLRPGLHGTAAGGAGNMPSKQVVFLLKRQVALICFVCLQPGLCALIHAHANHRWNAARNFPPTRVWLDFSLAVRPDGLFSFADN